MLVLLFDPRFKKMRLITMFLGHENVVIVVVEYDERLLFHLLIEANKLLMLDKVEEAFDLHSQMDFEGLFHSTTITHTHTHTHIHGHHVKGAYWISISSY